MARGGAASHRCRRSHCVKASALNGQGGASTSELSGHGTGERGARTGLCRLPTRLCGGRRPLHFSGNLHFYSVCVSFFFFFFCCFNTLPLLSGSEIHTCTKEGSLNTSPLTLWKTPDPLPSRPEPEGSAPGGAGHGTPDFSPRLFRGWRPQATQSTGLRGDKGSRQVFTKNNSTYDSKGPVSHSPKPSRAPQVFCVTVDTCKMKYRDFCSLFLNKTGGER